MALDLPETADEVSKRMKVDVQRELETSNPFLRRSWLLSIIVSIANRIFDFYYSLRQAELEAVPDTAVRNLDRWAAVWGVNRYAGQPAYGNVWMNATATPSLIPPGALLVDSDGKEYYAQAFSASAVDTIAVTSVTSSGLVATITTSVPHGLGSVGEIGIDGAVESAYNRPLSLSGGTPFTVIDATTIEYPLLVAAPSSPATGTILLTRRGVSVPVASTDFGEAQNIDADTALFLQSPVAGISSPGRVDQDAIIGGSDIESDASLRARMLSRIQNPVAHFNVADIERTMRAIPGVTRVWIREATPAAGQVQVFHVRDNDVGGPIPLPAQIAEVLAAVQAIRPANVAVADVTSHAPVAIITPFTFATLVPNTPTMRDAVLANLQQFFDEGTDLGVAVTQDAYRSAIYNTVDTTTGDRLSSFTLSAPPAGSIAAASTDLITLGTVTFP